MDDQRTLSTNRGIDAEDSPLTRLDFRLNISKRAIFSVFSPKIRSLKALEK